MTIAAAASELYLQPGHTWFGGGTTRVRTILGSCVAITLWHPIQRLGGICHFMLPGRLGAGTGVLDGRYATDAMRLLLHEITASGYRPDEFEAKLFGAGRMFPSSPSSGSAWDGMSVQERNVDIARQLVARHGVRVIAEHLGGHGHRQVLFDLASGNAWLKHTPLQVPGEPPIGCRPA